MNENAIAEKLFGNIEELTAMILVNTYTSHHTILNDLEDYQDSIHANLLAMLLNRVELELSVDRLNELSLDYDQLNKLAEDGLHLEEIVELLAVYRRELITYIQKECSENQYTISVCNQINNKIMIVFDEAIRQTTRDYNSRHLDHLKIIQKELLNLSAPIVPIKANVSVIPLIGTFTPERSEAILNETIPKVADANVDKLIIDFSGVYNFDTYVASQLIVIFDTLKLLGINPILSGMRPEMAQTTIQLGVNLNEYPIYSNVKKALEHI